MRFTIVPSPCEDVGIVRYEESAFPKFKQVFDPPVSSSLALLAVDPAEAVNALIMENRSGKAITALCHRWITTDASGNQRKHTFSSDSYMVDVYRSVVEAGQRLLITRTKRVNETIIDHVLSGGGCMVGGGSSRVRGNEPDTVELTFQLDFILFEDGEIAGPDPDRYAAVLQCRKPAAEFVAKQIRLAEAEGRDVRPVLSALVQIPHFGSLHHEQGDRLVQWTQYYARDYLDRAFREPSRAINWREAALRHLENRPELPKFYRRGSSASS